MSLLDEVPQPWKAYYAYFLVDKKVPSYSRHIQATVTDPGFFDDMLHASGSALRYVAGENAKRHRYQVLLLLST